MSSFKYEAMQSDGQLVGDTIEAENVGAAIERLQSAGLTVLSIAIDKDLHAGTPSTADPTSIDPPPPGAADSKESLASNALLKNLDRILSRSERLKAGLEAVAGESISPQMVTKVNRFIQTLDTQTNARDFLHRDENLEWLPVLVSSRSEESDNDRWQSMLRLVEADKRSHSAWQEFIYPALVLFAGLVVLVILQINIVYPFSQLFRAFGLTLPPPTLLLVTVTEFCVHYPWQVIMGLLLATVALIATVRWWRAYALTTRWFGVAIAGNTSSVRAMGRFVRLMADALSLEATLPQALRIAGRGCGHAHYRDMSARLAQSCEQDSRSLVDNSVAHNFPPTMLATLTSSPGSHSSPHAIDLLRRLAQMYEARANQRRPVTAGFWGPIALGFVGLFIAFIVLAIFSPLVQMITSLT